MRNLNAVRSVLNTIAALGLLLMARDAALAQVIPLTDAKLAEALSPNVKPPESNPMLLRMGQPDDNHDDTLAKLKRAPFTIFVHTPYVRAYCERPRHGAVSSKYRR